MKHKAAGPLKRPALRGSGARRRITASNWGQLAKHSHAGEEGRHARPQ